MKKFYLFFIFIISSFAFSQAPLSITKSEPVSYESVELQPQFPGGLAEFNKFIARNFNASDLETGGEIIVTFVIETNGNVSQIKVLKDIGANSAAEAKRIVAMSPKWKAGENNGVPVRVYFRLPININI